MIWLLTAAVLALALLGAPVFALMGGLALWLFHTQATPATAVIIELYRLATLPALIAIPLFTFAGYVLAESGAPYGPGLDAYASAEHEDLYSAIDEVRDDIVRDLRSKKGKRLSYIRRSGARVKDMVKGLLPWGEEGWYKRRR